MRKPTPTEEILEDLLGDKARLPKYLGIVERPLYKFLSTERPVAESECGQRQSEGNDNEKLGSAAGAGLGDANEAS